MGKKPLDCGNDISLEDLVQDLQSDSSSSSSSDASSAQMKTWPDLWQLTVTVLPSVCSIGGVFQALHSQVLSLLDQRIPLCSSPF
jgi:hypothetical protein